MTGKPGSRRRLALAAIVPPLLLPSVALADDDDAQVPKTWGAPHAAPSQTPAPPASPPPSAPPAAEPPAQSSAGRPPPAASSAIPVAHPQSEERASGVEPKAVDAPPAKLTFAADPIADGAIIIAAGTFALILQEINGTGEIRPQQISPNFDRSHLLMIDRGAVNQDIDQDSRTRSNITLFAAGAFAAIDPVLTAIRENHLQAGLVDGIIYLQSIAITLGVTNLAKIAVRRPRPAAYIEAEQHKNDPSYSNADTDSALSFFSGHSSVTATIAATASYLAFVRSTSLWRPLVTLGVGSALTTFTAVERVRAGAHFPTDVIAGAIAGAGIGVIVTHLHRSEDVKQRRIWVGYAPVSGGGGLSLGGLF